MYKQEARSLARANDDSIKYARNEFQLSGDLWWSRLAEINHI